MHFERDPDRNVVEIAASIIATKEEALACLASEAFGRNPGGREIDPDSLAQR